jgi:ABC-type bacteriocin/lantibiotic exporter with double-glycine peptidase domain
MWGSFWIQDTTNIRPLPQNALQLQQLDNSCGIAALAYVLQTIGLPASEHDLLNRIELSSGGATLLQLRDLANDQGIPARGWRLDLNGLSRAPMPAIVHFKDHYVVVEEVTEATVIVADPASGRFQMSHSAFKRRWSGVTLTFNEGDG